MLDSTFLLLALTVISAVPLVYAALGGTCSERSGVVNIALEGILLGGAFGAAVFTHKFGNPWLGVLGAVVTGIAVSLLHAFLTVTFRIDQIIAGLAINIFVAGATDFGSDLLWEGTASKAIAPLPQWRIVGGGSNAAYFLNALLGRPLVLACLMLVPVVWLAIARMRYGLRLRAVGENPAACDTLGISVPKLRYSGVVLSGLFAGLGGAWSAFYIEQFQPGMSAGKGFIAMAAVVCGRWNPLAVTGACLFFALAAALERALPLWGVQVPGELLSTFPYALTMVAVAGLMGRAKPPAALGIPYEK